MEDHITDYTYVEEEPIELQCYECKAIFGLSDRLWMRRGSAPDPDRRIDGQYVCPSCSSPDMAEYKLSDRLLSTNSDELNKALIEIDRAQRIHE